MRLSRGTGLFALLSLIGAFAAVYGLNAQPGYTDAFYHYNAAVNIASGAGFVDDYLWVYIGAPQELPAPSHLYWMPGTSLLAALGMVLFGMSYAAAQVGFALCLWGAVLVAYHLGRQMGSTARHAWLAGSFTLAGGFFLRFWGQTDTFAPYALVGSLALLCMGYGASSENRAWRWWLLAGGFAALGHLVRSDGLLLLIVGWLVLLWPFAAARIGRRLRHGLLFMLAYGLLMLPWFLRNLEAIGTVLPVSGTQAAWFTEYNDLFNYPPGASPETLFVDGWGLFLRSRWEALFGSGGALLNFIAVEGLILLAPFILLELWQRRGDAFLRPVWLFALGLHAAFALVFPFPGMRGGLFHAAAALLPWWMALGVLGLDRAIEWAAKRRKRWNPRTAKPVFSVGMLLIAVVFSLSIALPGRIPVRESPLHESLAAQLPPDAVVMINDPAQLYYYTGLSGVPLPNASVEAVREIAQVYDVDYLLLECGGLTEPLLLLMPECDGNSSLTVDALPDYLRLLELDIARVRLYAIELD